MLELCESQAIAVQLEKELLGKKIVGVEANKTPHKFAFFYGEPEEYAAKLVGKTVDGVIAFGSYVEILAEGMCVQLAENPVIRYIQEGGALPVKHQLCLAFDDGSHLCCTTQMFACLFVCREGENTNPYYLVGKEKVSPLEEGFNYAYFTGLRQGLKPGTSLKAFLATEQRIPGFGNGLLQDTLFLAGLHPKRKIGAMSEEEWQKLFETLKALLPEVLAKGGRDTEKDIYGNAGGYKTQLSAVTWKEPCPKCGGPITKQAYLGGSVYFCPVCQKL